MYERMSSYVCHHPLDSEASIEASSFFKKQMSKVRHLQLQANDKLSH